MAERSSHREHDDVNRCRRRKSGEERRPQHVTPQLYINSNIEGPQNETFPAQDVGYIIDPEEDVIMREFFPGLSYGLVRSASAKPGSTTTDGTLLSVGSPSVMTEDGTGSFVHVNHRKTYSDNSFDSSDGTLNHPQYSTPDEDGCIDGADVTAHTAVSESVTAFAPHDAQYVLSSLASRQPRTIPVSYRTDIFSNSNDSEYNDSSRYVFHRNNGFEDSFTSAESSRTHNGSEAPWNHVQNQVSRYPSGYVAFAPAPGPDLEPFSHDLRTQSVAIGLSTAPSFASSPSIRSRRSSSQSRRSSRDRRKKTPYTWENRTVSNDGLKIIVQDEDTVPKRRNGIRQGKLAPETAEKARRIRRIRACWNCWTQKVPCSEGDTCDKCRKLFSPISDQICCRSGFKDYVPIFFPDFLHSHLKKRQIERLISENVSRWGHQTISVEVTTGEVFKPMVLRVNDFQSQREFLLHPRLTKGEGALPPSQPLRLETPYSIPVGIVGLDMDDMRKKCDKHIEEMINNKRYADQVTAGDPNPIPRRILEIALRFRSATGKEMPLVRNALKLHAFHYFMGSLMSFTEESAFNIYRVMLYDGIPGLELSSRLLNRQVKYIMHKLHRELTETVLKDLEKSLRSRTKDAWAPTFCSILVLCLCMESLQTAAHIMIVCEFQKPDPSPEYSRNQSKTACLELDEHPFSQSTKLFHDIYRTHKDHHFRGPRDGGAFNPLMAVGDGIDTNLSSPAADEMVKSVHKMIHENYQEVFIMAEKTPAVNLGHAIQPQTIKESNTGRLACKFLKSFFH